MLAGLGAGSAVVALGFAASVVVFPPARQAPDTADAPAAQPADTAPAGAGDGMSAPAGAGDGPQPAEAEAPDTATAPPEPSPDTRDTAMAEAPDSSADAPQAAPATAPAEGQPRDAAPQPAAEAARPGDPAPERAATVPVPEGTTGRTALPEPPAPPRDAPRPDAPAAPTPMQEDPAPTADADTALADAAAATDPAAGDTEQATTAGTGDGATSANADGDTPRAGEDDTPASRDAEAGENGPPETRDESAPEAGEATAAQPAVVRNSLFTGTVGTRPLMAVILFDPGLPTPLREDMAARPIPFTVALNPMDPSAQAAARLYRAAGKEVVILATGLPDGAQPSDLDVTFGAYFDALPQAVAVLDPPQGGFARNARLTDAVMPQLARDGYGVLSFAGGLSRVESAAAQAGVAQAEVFRVLDDDGQSAFTIRRYLDRAVFQANQIGQVIVYGDATNTATMDALEMWRTDGRAGQVALVPVSAILRNAAG